jgi:hypothetical protein
MVDEEQGTRWVGAIADPAKVGTGDELDGRRRDASERGTGRIGG